MSKYRPFRCHSLELSLLSVSSCIYRHGNRNCKGIRLECLCSTASREGPKESCTQTREGPHTHTHAPQLRAPALLPWSKLKLSFRLHISVFCSVLLQSSKPPPRLALQPLAPATSCLIFFHYSEVDGGRGGQRKGGKTEKKVCSYHSLFLSKGLAGSAIKTKRNQFRLAPIERAAVGRPRADTHDEWTQTRSQSTSALSIGAVAPSGRAALCWYPHAILCHAALSSSAATPPRSRGPRVPSR